MRSLAIGLLVLLMAAYINMEEMNVLDDILVYPIPAPMRIEKREAPHDATDKFTEFLEEKLAQHTQALEHILKTVDHHEETIKQLIDNLSKNLEKPKLPVKVEPQKVKQQKERRSNDDEETENPIMRLGKNIPKYGRLAKDIFLGTIQTETDPTPLVEKNPDPPTVQESARRSNSGGDPEIDPTQQNKEELSSWCELAMLCEKTVNPVCGFDDNYGYGKFDDMCHMLHVNCYYKYNFVMVHTCHPVI